MYTYELQAQCWLGGGSAGWGSGGWLEMLFIPPTRFLFPVKLARTSGLTLARNTSFSRDKIVTVSSSFDILSRSSSTSDLTALIRWDFTKSIACSILLSMEPCPAPEALKYWIQAESNIVSFLLWCILSHVALQGFIFNFIYLEQSKSFLLLPYSHNSVLCLWLACTAGADCQLWPAAVASVLFQHPAVPPSR